jgi:hypothetical protein
VEDRLRLFLTTTLASSGMSEISNSKCDGNEGPLKEVPLSRRARKALEELDWLKSMKTR